MHSRVCSQPAGGEKAATRIWREEMESDLNVEMGDWCAGDDFTASSVPVTLTPSPSQEQFEFEKLAAEYDSKMSMPAAVGGGSMRRVEKKNIETVEKMKKRQRKRITSQPPIIAHYHPEGEESNNRGLGGVYARIVETKYVQSGGAFEKR